MSAIVATSNSQDFVLNTFTVVKDKETQISWSAFITMEDQVGQTTLALCTGVTGLIAGGYDVLDSSRGVGNGMAGEIF